MTRFLIITFILLAIATPCHALNVERLADAIYQAEGGAKTKHPYGVLSVKCKTTLECRQITINSIKRGISRYNRDRASNRTLEGFISHFARRWCPIGAKNDPKGLNQNWVKNVLFFYKKG